MSNIRSVSLSMYTSPHVEEVRSKEWVEYRIKNQREYRHPNGYYQYLIDRASNSVTNGSVIGGFCKFIYGEGLDIENAAKNTDLFVQIKSLIKSKDLKKAVSDRKKLMMCALQVTKDKGKVISITHFPMKTLLPEKMNEDGEIEAWYYNPDWEKDTQGKDAIRIPSFGFGGNSGNEIYIIRGYTAGSDYFGEDEGYSAALAYAVLEEEIADYQINDAQNGFTPTTIINFNNGKPEDDNVKDDIVRDIYAKTTGATGKKVIVAFNDDETKKTTVEKVAIDDAPDHYAYLSQECVDKILAGHRAPSELLGFNNDSGGFANNAEELQNKFKAFVNFEVQPFQMEFLDALQEILAVNDISVRLLFRQLMPFDFGAVEETPDQTTLSAEEHELTDEEGVYILEGLDGEKITDEWEFVDIRECSDENESVEDWAKRTIIPKRTLLSSIIKSKPSQDSYLDKSIYKVRYSYQQKYGKGQSRPFCRAMMRRTDNGVVYRLEDIDKASRSGVNRELGHKKRPYDLFKFKGGVNCSHYWAEELYRLKKKTDGSYVEDKALSSSEEVDEIPKSYRPRPAGHKRSKQVEKDRLDKGHHPNYFK